MINAAGIDGCKSGWMLFYYQNKQYHFKLIKSIAEAELIFQTSLKIFIDIPIGLSSHTFHRQLEKQMRKLLKNRSSTVFTPPCRAAIQIVNYQEANFKNREITGKGLSKQSFNIRKKIAEVDDFLQTKRNYQLVESHPEICFKILDGNVLQTKKNTAEGQQARRQILSKNAPKLDDQIEQALKQFPKSHVQPDDIIDAAILCLSAQISLSFHTLTWKDPQIKDEKGLAVKVEAGEIT